MSSASSPLDPRLIAEIDGLLADEDDPAIWLEVRSRSILLAQKEANEAAGYRGLFRNALEEARRIGDPEPEAFAEQRVATQMIVDRYERRIRAITNRVEIAHAKRVDKLETKYEVASKSANPNRRRFPQLDRQYVEIIGEAERAGHLNDGPLVLSKLPTRLQTYRLPHWEKTTISLKVMALSLECSRQGAQTINLRPNQEVCAKALRSPRGPAGYMQDAIRRAMERTFGKAAAPEFWIVIETDTAHQFHIHGAVVTPSLHNGVDLVDAALRAAGGEWGNVHGQHHQQVSASLDDPIYWASYTVKRMNIAKSHTDRKLFACTSGLRSAAKAGWDGLRGSLPQAPG